MGKILKTTTKIISSDDIDAKAWNLPHVADEGKTLDESATNVLGKHTAWQYEPPEEIVDEEVKPLTAEEIEEIRQAAFEEGFNQGKEEGFSVGYAEGKEKGINDGKLEGVELGKAEGMTLAQTDIDELTTRWQQLIDQLNQPMHLLDEQVCQQVLALVSSLTEAVVLQEAKTNPDILVSAIKEGVKALPIQEAQTTIMMHPDDIALVEKAFGEAHIVEKGWRFLPEPAMTQGSCQIENSTSQIDLQIKTRLKDVLEPFLQDASHQLTASE